MTNHEGYTSLTQTFEQPTEVSQEQFRPPQDLVASFKTAHGSVYKYDERGQTTRFKTATSEQLEPQDITVFANLSTEQEQDVLLAYRSKNPTQKTKVYVVERQDDNAPKIIRKIGDVEKPDALYLAIFRDGVMAENARASLYPVVGANVFDTRYFQKNDVWMTERHLGNKVAEITYR